MESIHASLRRNFKRGATHPPLRGIAAQLRNADRCVMRTCECPKCGKDISDSYEPADESVGIMAGGWYCDECEEFVINEDDVEEE